MEGFNYRNVLFDITFRLIEKMVHVTFEGIYGVNAASTASTVTFWQRRAA
jgi:hypothetical protein